LSQYPDLKAQREMTASLVLTGQMAHKGHRVYPEIPVDLPDLPDLLVLMVHKEYRGQLDQKDQLELMESLALTVKLDHKVSKVRLVKLDHKVSKVRLAKLDHKVYPVLTALTVIPVSKAKLDHKVYPVLTALTVSKVSKVSKVRLAKLDHKVIPESKAKQGSKESPDQAAAAQIYFLTKPLVSLSSSSLWGTATLFHSRKQQSLWRTTANDCRGLLIHSLGKP
tara:strand:+ start:438 stop:1106 length:669 start_codon:yes stop_codon:yes gene_type:complete